MNHDKTRSGLLGIVAAYLIYTAYELYENREASDTTMTPAARIFFIALFGVCAVALLVYAYRVWKRSEKKENEEPLPRDDENSMK